MNEIDQAVFDDLQNLDTDLDLDTIQSLMVYRITVPEQLQSFENWQLTRKMQLMLDRLRDG